MKAVHIMWDVDYAADGKRLPLVVDVPNGMDDEEDIADYLSDLTGFCHNGFELVNDDDDNDDEEEEK